MNTPHHTGYEHEGAYEIAAHDIRAPPQVHFKVAGIS
jgi:hypothetical protein